MKAVVCSRLGTPNGLELVEVAEPVAGPGQIVVDVAHLGLNFHETLLVAGRHVVSPALPFSPGSEYAGVVSAVGPDVTGVRVGDRVAGNEEYGMARERVAVAADRATVLPAGVDGRTAAGVLVAAATALHAFDQRAGLVAGETVAVLGATGGVGLAAVDIARLLGARVIACASTTERAAFLRTRADWVVDLSAHDLKQELRKRTGGAGVDVVLDPVGGPLAESAVRALAWGGRHLVVGFASGEIPRLPLNLPLVKGAGVLGVFLGEFTRREPAAHRRNVARILRWAAAARLAPHVHAELPLHRYAEGLEMLAARQVRGKVLVAV